MVSLSDRRLNSITTSLNPVRFFQFKVTYFLLLKLKKIYIWSFYALFMYIKNIISNNFKDKSGHQAKLTKYVGMGGV